MVELQVVLVLEVSGHARPQGFHVVDDLVLVGILIFTVLPFLFLTEDDGHGQEAAILLQQTLDACWLEEFFLIVIEGEDDIGASFGLVTVLHFKLGRAVTGPADGLGTLLPAQGTDFHFLGNHKGRVETQTEVADDGIGVVLVFLEELLGSREGNLVDVLVDFLGSHADTAIAHGERSGFLIHGDVYGQTLGRTLKVACSLQGLELLSGINGVAYQLTQENLVVTVQKFLNNGEDVVGRYPNSSFWHNIL